MPRSPSIPPTPDLLSIPAAFALVHQIAPEVPLFSLCRIYWRQRHGVPSLRVGHALFFPRAELEAWAKRFARAVRRPPAGVRRRHRRTRPLAPDVAHRAPDAKASPTMMGFGAPDAT
jgi:hypothetical protein